MFAIRGKTGVFRLLSIATKRGVTDWGHLNHHLGQVSILQNEVSKRFFGESAMQSGTEPKPSKIHVLEKRFAVLFQYHLELQNKTKL